LEKVCGFDQTHSRSAFHLQKRAGRQQGAVMAVRDGDKRKEYTRYAATCLEMAVVAPSQEARAVHREMAAEWQKLADSVRRRPRHKQMQME
jgi:hypothetical protein